MWLEGKFVVGGEISGEGGWSLGAAQEHTRSTATKADREGNQITSGGFRTGTRGGTAGTREEKDMREGLGAFHRATFCCAVFALAIAGLAIAEDSDDSDKRDTLRAREFEEFDTAGDGHHSKEERAAARARRYERRLEEFDADGDGRLSREEQAAARARRHERHLKEFDADGDGKLTGEEREQAQDARERHRKRRGRGPGGRPAVDQPGNAPEEP